MPVPTAEVIRITPDSVVYVRDLAGPTIEAFVFRNLSGYRGETARELATLGLRLGAVVDLEYDERERVKLVTLRPAPDVDKSIPGRCRAGVRRLLDAFQITE